jgi:hypothetical protein
MIGFLYFGGRARTCANGQVANAVNDVAGIEQHVATIRANALSDKPASA